MSLFDNGNGAQAMAAEAERLAAETGAPAPGAEAGNPAADGSDVSAADADSGSASRSADAGADAATGDDDAGESGRAVPFRALKAERQKRQQVEREFHTLQGQVRAWQNAMLAQIQASNGNAANATPSAEDDPVGALRHTQQQLAELQGAVAAQVEAHNLHGAYVAGAQAFSREHPDFADAYSHMIRSRADELRVLGAPEPAIAQQLRIEEQQMVAAAVRAGRNPAEIAYAAARARGWRPGQGTPVRTAGEGVDRGAGQPVAPSRAAAALALAPGGRANRDAISAEDLTRLSGRDFDTGWEKLFGRRGDGLFASR